MRFDYTIKIRIKVGQFVVHKTIRKMGHENPNVEWDRVETEMREKYSGEVNVENIHVHDLVKYKLWWAVKAIEEEKKYGIR